MSTVQLTCILCGAADRIPVQAMLASVDVPDRDADLAGVVSWVCAGCQQVATVELSWQPFLILVTAGVPLFEDNADPEPAPHLPPHPEQLPCGRAFVPDDLLELHELLGTEAWFDALATDPGLTA